MKSNADALARYAALCQEANLVPIVEPEVLMDGAHTIARCEEATAYTLRSVFAALEGQGVFLEGRSAQAEHGPARQILPGAGNRLSGRQRHRALPAPHSAGCPAGHRLSLLTPALPPGLAVSVPAALPGIVFLSGGQTPIQATEYLNAINSLDPQPWELSFSYGRALQEPALAAWKGEAANIESVQHALYSRALCNSAARHGNYSPELAGVVEAKGP